MSTTTTTVYHGQSTQNKTREQEGQSSEEIWRQVCDREGGTEQRKKSRIGERKREYHIVLENTTHPKQSFLIAATSTDQIVQTIQENEKRLCHPSVGFLFSDTRTGTLGRTYFSNEIPEGIDTIYVKVYLKTHSGFPIMKN